MAKIVIPFAGSIIDVDVPDKNIAEVLTPCPAETIEDFEGALERALDHPINQAPLEDIVSPSDRVILVSDDNTRLTPVDRMIPPLLRRMNRAIWIGSTRERFPLRW